MSTRGCIARLRGRTPLAFKGVYHHWDSYPSGLGQTLFRLRNQGFKGDTAALLKALIDEHPAGWSTVVGSDQPQCYCHDDRHEAGFAVTHKNAAQSGIEYAYLFRGAQMVIAGSFCGSGNKMIGMFGCGDPDAVWSVIAEINLDGPEPDWKALDQEGVKEREEAVPGRDVR